jgi:hypothetical protein
MMECRTSSVDDLAAAAVPQNKFVEVVVVQTMLEHFRGCATQCMITMAA